MLIDIKDKKLKASLEDPALGQKTHGKEMAQKLQRRLEALAAAESLVDFWPPYSGPERCHCLKGDMAGIFSVDLKHPFRLLFKATEVPKEESSEEKARWALIKSIEIIGIADTHE